MTTFLQPLHTEDLSKKMKLFISTAWVYLATISTGVYANVAYSDVLGKTFITDAGSSSGSFIMSVSVNTKSRSTVEVKFVENSISWSGGNVSAIESDLKVENLISVMINCRDKTYSPGIFAKRDAYEFRTYQAGSAYKWGAYNTGEIINNSKAGSALTQYFQTACAYSAQF